MQLLKFFVKIIVWRPACRSCRCELRRHNADSAVGNVAKQLTTTTHRSDEVSLPSSCYTCFRRLTFLGMRSRSTASGRGQRLVESDHDFGGIERALGRRDRSA